MKKIILMLLLILLTLSLPAKNKLEDTKWASWDTVENYLFAAGTTLISWQMTQGQGIFGGWAIGPAINYGKEAFDWYYYGECNDKDIIVKSLGMVTPYILTAIMVGYSMGYLDTEFDEILTIDSEKGEHKWASHLRTSLEMEDSWQKLVLSQGKTRPMNM